MNIVSRLNVTDEAKLSWKWN